MKRFSRSLRAVLAFVVLCAPPIVVNAQAQQTIQEAVSSGKLIVSVEGTGGSSGDREKIWVDDVAGAIEGGAAGAGSIPPIIIGGVVIPGWATGAFLGAVRGSLMAFFAGGIE